MFGPHLEVGGTAPTLAALCSDLPDPKEVVLPSEALLPSLATCRPHPQCNLKVSTCSPAMMIVMMVMMIVVLKTQLMMMVMMMYDD